MSKHDEQEIYEDMNWELESKLEPGMQRFLAHVMEDGLQNGLRTQEDFIRHFPPIEIMQGLSERPDLRANILVPTTGVRAKIAAKKSAVSSGEDLQIALDEGETDAGSIVSLFHPDDRARYLDNVKLWNYIVEPCFWTQTKNDGASYDRAKSHVAFILDRAIEDNLMTMRDIVDGISVGTMVQHLRREDLQAVIETALSNSHKNETFTEDNLFNVVHSKGLVENVPLAVIWDQVVYPKIAQQNGFEKTKIESAKDTPWATLSMDSNDEQGTQQPETTDEVNQSAENGITQTESY